MRIQARVFLADSFLGSLPKETPATQERGTSDGKAPQAQQPSIEEAQPTDCDSRSEERAGNRDQEITRRALRGNF